MIDPITAVAMATSAFKTVQKMVSMGREIEDTLGQVGKWYGAVSDFNEAKRQAENPPIFRRLVASKSVEQEALEMYAHDKRIKQQEKELRELLMYTYGPDAYKELLGMRRKIRDQREKTLYAQARKRRAFIWNVAGLAAVVIMSGVLYQLTTLILGKM
jgi:GrpB-like predicted nucleotidyltransferase (UPF0157 family)